LARSLAARRDVVNREAAERETHKLVLAHIVERDDCVAAAQCDTAGKGAAAFDPELPAIVSRGIRGLANGS
jgi:hypothetical protein